MENEACSIKAGAIAVQRKEDKAEAYAPLLTFVFDDRVDHFATSECYLTKPEVEAFIVPVLKNMKAFLDESKIAVALDYMAEMGFRYAPDLELGEMENEPCELLND